MHDNRALVLTATFSSNLLFTINLLFPAHIYRNGKRGEREKEREEE
jgi:hypothetical protein